MHLMHVTLLWINLKTNATFWKLEEFENENNWVIQDKKEIEALEKWS